MMEVCKQCSQMKPGADPLALRRVGVAVDNWKQKRFRQELNKAGFRELEVTPLMSGVSFISVIGVEPERVHDIHKLCLRLERELKSRN